MKDYYEILEVNQKASKEIIEKAYRVLAKKYHPDLYSGEKRKEAEQQLKDINEAYQVLSNTFLREQYDKEITKEVQGYQNSQNPQKLKKNPAKDNRKNTKHTSQKQETRGNHKIGSLMAIVDILKEIFKQRTRKNGSRKLKKEDKIAAVLTVIIMLTLGIILWFIPATNGFIRSLNPF